MNMKLMGEAFYLAADINSSTLASICTNKGWKKLFIKFGGKSKLDAPLGTN
jgi:hypothetical protein